MDGFCPNEVPIELNVLPSDPLFDAKLDFWTRGENDTNSLIIGDQPVNISLAIAAAAMSQQHDKNAGVTTAVQAVVSTATDDVSKLRCVPGQAHNSRIAQSYDSKRRIRVCVSNNENTRVLFSMLRVLVCNEEELCTITSSPTLPFGDSRCSGFLNRALRGFTGHHSESSTQTLHNIALFRTARDIRHPLNLRNEKTAMQLLLNIIKVQLDLYPTTLDKDMADLMDDDAFPRFSNKRHAKIQVRGEKEVLHHFAIWAQSAIDVIAIVEKEVDVGNGITGSISPEDGFEYFTRMMEEDESIGPHGLHNTIVRYCCDVLGALRREALSNTKKGKEMVKNQEF